MRRGVLEDHGDTQIFYCPGCEMPHGVYVGTDQGRAKWTFNGNHERPTFSPSILVQGSRRMTPEEVNRVMRGEVVVTSKTVCHSFVEDGKIRFLGDCTHALAGQTVDLSAEGLEDW